jgi:plastocyanin
MRRIHAIRGILFRLLLVTALAVLSGGAIAGFGAAPAGAATVALSVHDFAFSPTPLTVPLGTTVTVTNTGASTHTWSSDPGDAQQWNSGDVAPGTSFSVTFTHAGTFTYHCNIHPFMTGTIVVTASTPATTAAPVTTPTTPTTSTASTPATATPQVAAAVTAPTTAVRATALPRTGASHSGLLVTGAATSMFVGLALAASGSRRWRRGIS